MQIDNFVKEYKVSENKSEYVRQHIIKEYLPYEQKIAICKNIIDTADYTPMIDGLDKKYYSPNTPMRFVLFCMSIIIEYTDIELNQINSGKDIIGGFNLLDSINMFEILFKELNKEYNMLNTVLQMMVDDSINKENSLVSFLSSKFDAIKTLYDIALPYIENQVKEQN